MNKIKIALLILFAVQLAVPLSMIWKKEGILEKGEVVKFQVRPVDPYDPFRGKYLSIGLTEDQVYTDTKGLNEDQTVYVLLSTDISGFAQLIDLSEEPYEGELYLKCTINYVMDDYVAINPPFDRYYINEAYSELGEELYNRFSRGDREDAYVSVRISRGEAVLEDMYLAGKEINQLIEEELKP